MPLLAIWTHSAYGRDELFSPDSPMNRDDCLSCFRALKARAEAMGWECHTRDVYEREGRIPDVILFLNIPHRPLGMLLDTRYKHTKRWVILYECIAVRRINWRPRAQAQFSKIFTWDDSFIDNKRYFKINFAQEMPTSIEINEDKPRLCAMIVANKHSRHHLELYSERLAAIRWFAANHPEDFDLYGFGWDNLKKTKLWSSSSRSGASNTDITRCYRGIVTEKIPILRQYKFAICYENARDISGYITEKILDCLSAGCVPVYLGANNISDHIPVDCFIDKRRFENYSDLYAYLTKMDKSTYRRYLESINDFLASERSRQFSSDFFAEVICNALKYCNLEKVSTNK